MISWDTSLQMFYIKPEQNSPRRNKVFLCGGNGIIGCGQRSCSYTIRGRKPLVISQQLRNSYCLTMIVSIGRHDKGQGSLRGIVKNISLLLPNVFAINTYKDRQALYFCRAKAQFLHVSYLLVTHNELSLPYF